MKAENLNNEHFPDDPTLARRIAAGEQEALTILYTRYTDPLYAFLYHHLGDRSLTEDLWQETWMAALHAIPGYRGQSSLFTWLCGIARHKIADHYRQLDRSSYVFHDLPTETLSTPDGLLPDEIVQSRAIRLQVVETLAALPEDYRAALVARYADECSVEEIAGLLGKPYKATESLLSRAKAAFRSLFRNQGEIQ